MIIRLKGIAYLHSFKSPFLSLIFCGFILMNSCTEPFFPELTDFENRLIVDGQITNEPGPYMIRLSLSSDLGSIRFIPFKNAKVTILEENGISETLTEIEAGIYQTSATGIQGKVGHRYKIEIESAESKRYESTYQELKAPTAIADVYAEVETRFFTDINKDRTGYQFYVDSEEPVNEKDYFLWIIEETFKYKVEHEIGVIFPDIPFPDPDSLQTCWREDSVNYVTTYNPESFATPEVKGIPLHFVKSTDLELSLRYSPLVKQYTISKEAFEYWKVIETQLQLDAPLYSTQPYQTRGNIKNINDENEAVFGFFLVAGVHEKRTFVNAIEGAELFDIDCFFEYASYSFALGQPREFAPFYPALVGVDEDGRLGFLPIKCLDCRSHEGTIIEPDYWED